MPSKIRELRRKRQWSVAELSRQSGIHRHTIEKWEATGTDDAVVSKLRRVASALGCGVTDLID